jgi:hypothetical protein
MYNRKIGHLSFSVVAILAASAGACVALAQSADRRWMNANLSPEERAHLVLKQMTLEEKLSLLHGNGMAHNPQWTMPLTEFTNGGAGYVEGVNSLALFDQMGRPENLSAVQIARLQKAGSMSPAEPVSIQGGRITTTVPPYGLVVLLIRHR